MKQKSIFVTAFCGLLAVTSWIGEVFHKHVYIKAGLFAAALYLLYRITKLSLNDIGILTLSRKAIIWSILSALLVFVCLGIVFLISPNVFKDARYNQSLSSALFAIFITLPFTTVLLEEFAFRGVLLGFLLKIGPELQALIISSILFGLWHIMSSQSINVSSLPLIPHPSRLLTGIVVVAVTGLAGLFFSLLRIKTNSLLVPIAAHWSLNASGMFFAWLSWRR